MTPLELKQLSGADLGSKTLSQDRRLIGLSREYANVLYGNFLYSILATSKMAFCCKKILEFKQATLLRQSKKRVFLSRSSKTRVQGLDKILRF